MNVQAAARTPERHEPGMFPVQSSDLAGGEILEPLPPMGAWSPGTPLEWLEALFAAEPRTYLRSMPSRETFAWPGAEGRAVVKRYRGWAGEGWHREGTAGRVEFENLRELGRLGLEVPRPLAWFEVRGVSAWFSPRSVCVMEHVAHERDLRELAAELSRAERRGWLEELARLVARLHGAGWYHRDLYLQHLVAIGRAQPSSGGWRIAILDVGRARREAHPRRRWFVKDTAALLHSPSEAVTEAERLRFLARDLDLRGVGSRKKRRAFARAVARKAARIAAHQPRHTDPGGSRAR
ncbi:MAG TPA: lipopolysaccharide kinase InaA family protein [Planctomycetota bacterium]|nr:lipopolysaccharide kinase InaA family protein [Planctomycetota bacterium]